MAKFKEPGTKSWFEYIMNKHFHRVSNPTGSISNDGHYREGLHDDGGAIICIERSTEFSLFITEERQDRSLMSVRFYIDVTFEDFSCVVDIGGAAGIYDTFIGPLSSSEEEYFQNSTMDDPLLTFEQMQSIIELCIKVRNRP